MSHQDIIAALSQASGYCHAGGDGDCEWQDCPQLQDGEPIRSGRDCPLWVDLEKVKP